MGDLNAKVGKAETKTDCTGTFGLGEQNERGENLVDLCNTNNFVIANTLFQHHPRHLYTWISPDEKTRNQIDYIMLSKKWKSCIKNVKTRPGADCISDHQLLTADIKIRLKKMKRPPPPLRLDFLTLDEDCRVKISNSFQTLPECKEEKYPNELWKKGKNIILGISKETIARKKKRNNPWISKETLNEIDKRRSLKAKGIHNPVDDVIYKHRNALIQRLLREDKARQINEQCRKIEDNAVTNSVKDLYQGVRSLTNKSRPTVDTIKNENGEILCEGDRVRERWKEYCDNLYKKNMNIAQTPTRPIDNDNI